MISVGFGEVHLQVGLTIAGSDSGGGAGVQADIKAMHANGVYAVSALTAVTAQNTTAITAIHPIPPAIVEAQINAIFDDIDVHAVKTGMLGSVEVVELVASMLSGRGLPLVVDPVMAATTGHSLLDDAALDAVRGVLMPLADVITPNAPEAARLSGVDVVDVRSAEKAAHVLCSLGAQAVLVKGGHMDGGQVIDVLVWNGEVLHFSAPRLSAVHTHGTGCTLSSAIAANLAHGHALCDAVHSGIRYTQQAIAAGFALGAGNGPTDHFYFLDANRRCPPT